MLDLCRELSFGFLCSEDTPQEKEKMKHYLSPSGFSKYGVEAR